MEIIKQDSSSPEKVNKDKIAANLAKSISYRFRMEAPEGFMVNGREYKIKNTSDAIFVNGKQWVNIAEQILKEVQPTN